MAYVLFAILIFICILSISVNVKKETADNSSESQTALKSAEIKPQCISRSFPVIRYGKIKIIDYLIADKNYEMLYPGDIAEEDPNDYDPYDFIDMYYYPKLIAHLDRNEDEINVFVEYKNKLELIGYIDDEQLIELMPRITDSYVQISGGRGWRVYEKPSGRNKFELETTRYELTLIVSIEKIH